MSVRLTDRLIRSLSPKPTRYEVAERGGLKVRVFPTGARSFVYVYRHAGRLRRLTLGTYPALTLAAARVLVAQAKVERELTGNDPATEKARAAASALKDPTVEDLAHAYIERYAKTQKKSWKEDQRILNRSVIPIIGDIKASEVRRRDIIQLLESQAHAQTMANRTFAVIRKMFNWSVSQDLVETTPCYAVTPPGGRERPRDRVLSELEIKRLWALLSRDDIPVSPPLAVALKLSLTTAQRCGEVAGAELTEFDGEWWTIPAVRAKNKLSHRVPLSPLSLRLKRQLIDYGKDTNWLLPSPRDRNKPVASAAISRAVGRLRQHQDIADIERWTAHDLRRTAASKMASAGVPRLVIGKILNHAETGVTAIYDRHSYDAEKQKALFEWSVQLIGII